MPHIALGGRSKCSHPRCAQPGGIFIGTNDVGEDGWVCEKHIQYCSVGEQGWRLHRYIADARQARAQENWEDPR